MRAGDTHPQLSLVFRNGNRKEKAIFEVQTTNSGVHQAVYAQIEMTNGFYHYNFSSKISH
jgi:hypothetical protein